MNSSEIKNINIQGYTNSQGGNIGDPASFTYYLIDFPELKTNKTNPLVFVLDIMTSIVITGSADQSIIGKHTTRNIKATILRDSSGNLSVQTAFNMVHFDTETEDAQTNIEIRNKNVFMKFAGTPYGHSFACSATINYFTINTNQNTQKQTPRKELTSIIEDLNTGTIVVTEHNDLLGRSDASCHPGTSISNTPSGTISSTTVQAAINELDGDIVNLNNDITVFNNIITATKEPTGFENRTSSSLLYEADKRTLTINNIGTCYYWIKGVRYTLTGPLVSDPHVDVSGAYFFYFNAANVLTVSNQFWSFADHCPIAFVLYDTFVVGDQGILCDERHGITMDWATHAHLHFSKGAFVRSGFVIDPNSYVLNSSAINDKKYRIGGGYFVDEDIVLYHDDAPIMAPLVANRRYALMYRQGTSGDWTWSANELFPLLWSPTVGDYNPYYNQFVPGAPGSWQLTKITTNNRWFNVFTCVTNSAVAAYKLVNIVGQVLHSSLAAAQEESILSLEWGDVPFQEITPIYQATWRRGPYGGIGNPNVRPESIQKIVGISITLAGLLASNHPSLAGRDLPNQHPATAISYDNSATTGDLFSVDVQNAIEEIGDLINRGPQTGSITRVGGEVTEVEYVREFGATTVALTRVGGVVTSIVTTYKDGINPDIVRTKTLTYDIDGNLESWSTV